MLRQSVPRIERGSQEEQKERQREELAETHREVWREQRHRSAQQTEPSTEEAGMGLFAASPIILGDFLWVGERNLVDLRLLDCQLTDACQLDLLLLGIGLNSGFIRKVNQSTDRHPVGCGA